MEEMGLDDIEPLAPQQSHESDDLARKSEKIGIGRKVEVCAVDRNAGLAKAVDESAAVAVQDRGNIETVTIPQLAQLLENPDCTFRRRRNVTELGGRSNRGRQVCHPIERSTMFRAVGLWRNRLSCCGTEGLESAAAYEDCYRRRRRPW
jgi:hypothetical protein